MVAWGVAVGVTSALLLTRFLQNMVFGLSTADPGVMLAVSALRFAIAIAACWIPARRAMSVDPMVALCRD
jgi:ABC-type lipoprotein release transport system permease subunit